MVLAAVTQLTSSHNILSNLVLTTSLLKRCSSAGARVIFFPEATDFIAPSTSVSSLTYSSENSQFLQCVRDAAAKEKVWVSIGVHEPLSDEEGQSSSRCYNSQLLIDDSGQVVSRYRKTHLFDVDIKGGLKIKESDTTVEGSQLEEPIASPIGKLGVSEIPTRGRKSVPCTDLTFYHHCSSSLATICASLNPHSNFAAKAHRLSPTPRHSQFAPVSLIGRLSSRHEPSRRSPTSSPLLSLANILTQSGSAMAERPSSIHGASSWLNAATQVPQRSPLLWQTL